MSTDFTEYPIADSTRKVYECHLARFDTWRKDREVNDETLAQYLLYQFEQGKAPANAESILSAAKWRCLSQDLPDPRGRRCRAALKNFKRRGVGRGRGQVDGLTWEQVERVCSLATKERTLYGYRDAALIAVMSDALLRVSEAEAIDVDHLDFGNNALFIPRSKTDQTGKGAVQYLGPRTLEHVRTWLEKAKVTDGPLFRTINKDYLRAMKKRIGTYTIRKVVKQRCRDAGIEGRISGHSLRVGSAQSLAQRSASLVEMQQVGRWSDPGMPYRYARKFIAQQSAMARLRYGT